MAFESNASGTDPETLEVKLDPLQRAGVLLLAAQGEYQGFSASHKHLRWFNNYQCIPKRLSHEAVE